MVASFLEIVTREKSPPEDAAKYSSATSKVPFEMCVCAAQSVALPVRQANLTGTQAPCRQTQSRNSPLEVQHKHHTRISTHTHIHTFGTTVFSSK